MILEHAVVCIQACNTGFIFVLQRAFWNRPSFIKNTDHAECVLEGTKKKQHKTNCFGVL